MARIIKNGRITKFDPLKYPRGQRGRFADKPDEPSVTGRRSSKTGGVAKTDVRGLTQKQQARLEIYRSLTPEQRRRLQLLASLNPEQRKRLQEVIAGKQKKALEVNQEQPQVTKPVTTQALQGKPDKPKKAKRSTPSDRLSANPDHLTIKGNKLVMWEGKPELGKAQGGFNTRTVKNFEYAVEVNGQRVVLNRQTKMHEYLGDRIYGMPSLNTRLASMTPTQLADGLAKYMTRVDAKDTTVPDWLPTFHGKVDKSLLKNGYGKMQQHHIHQWARIPLENIVKDYESGKISLDEAKARTKAILSRESKKTKSGKLVEDWVLTPADKDQRAFVVLPGGLHDISNKPM
ncbi:hypothetical protein [Trichormus azollae]|jgi:hypothetical protein|uniref:Uncharacterized protein n=1 Tax=Nostoc azollae (strain 0708) TaxID=551115 RepID=D7E221_NOSA0|nr:hypothetical protein [Trichormus azollae]ADI63299.1 hypothetical protein Aazo_0892 ['Nostoc azollae' 0708]